MHGTHGTEKYYITEACPSIVVALGATGTYASYVELVITLILHVHGSSSYI